MALRIPEVAEALGVSPEHVRRALLAGELPGTRVGSVWLVPVEALRARLGLQDEETADGRQAEAVEASMDRYSHVTRASDIDAAAKLQEALG
jgi:excisionase family DNA binding protein